jgi:NADH-quinone oxidoreductase subunit N
VTSHDLLAILPELVLVLGGGVLVLAEVFAPSLRRTFGPLATIIALGAVVLRWTLAVHGMAFAGALRLDELGRFVDTYVLVAVVLAALVAVPYLRRTKHEFGEFHGLLLWAAAGAMVMAKTDHFLVVFVGLELLSISLYVLNAFHRTSGISLEAGWKYLVVGAFAAAILLFGIALTYGATGTFSLVEVTDKAAGGDLLPTLLLLAGLALILAGFAFKLAVVPFHAWAPDVYQGSPTPVTAFLSVVPKGAVLVVLARVSAAFVPAALTPQWLPLLAAVAVASMVLGNLVAIAQRDLKRMLAYSGIAHMGYALVGLVAFGRDGLAGILVYFAAYTLMNIAAFAVVAAFSENEEEPHLLTDLAGQGWKRPTLSLALSIAMFSLAGIPPTVGFTAKFLVFRAAVNEGWVWLAVVGVLASLVSVFYYVRVVFYLYMKPLPKREPAYSEPWPIRLVAAGCAAAVVALGILPAWLLELAEAAAATLVR